MPPPFLDEEIELVMRGDASAYRRIVEQTSARLVRVSARILGSVEDAEDVVQEAYVKAYRSLMDGQFDRRSKVETWLYRIVVNGTLDAKRRRRATISTDGEGVALVAEGRGAAEERLALSELSGWLGELPPDQQAVLVMKVIEGMSSEEIAEVLECSEGAVEQRLVRARAALRGRRDDSDAS